MDQFEIVEYGYSRWNRCDHRYCFRPGRTMIEMADAAGLMTPILLLCRKHSGTDKTVVEVPRTPKVAKVERKEQ